MYECMLVCELLLVIDLINSKSHFSLMYVCLYVCRLCDVDKKRR